MSAPTTVNLLADMGAQPATLQGGLLFASKSTDTTPPVSTITSPANRTNVQQGTPVTVTGTAVDFGGAVVGGVEVSVDGGQTWHPAIGRTNWTYTFTPLAPASINIRSRAVDDSANLETPSAGITVIVPRPPVSIDAQVSVDATTASTTVQSPAFSTIARNELLLALVATDFLYAGGTNTTVTNVTGAGLTWALVVRTNVQNGTAEIWRAFAPNPLSSVTVTATLSQSVVSSMTVMSFIGADPSGTNGSGAIGATQSANAKPGAPTATLVTTRNNSLVLGVGTDWDNATPRTLGPGQTLIHQDLAPVGDTYWMQMLSNPFTPSGTSVAINDTAPTTDRYNLSICEILPAP